MSTYERAEVWRCRASRRQQARPQPKQRPDLFPRYQRQPQTPPNDPPMPKAMVATIMGTSPLVHSDCTASRSSCARLAW